MEAQPATTVNRRTSPLIFTEETVKCVLWDGLRLYQTPAEWVASETGQRRFAETPNSPAPFDLSQSLGVKFQEVVHAVKNW